jgi:hypothetical protein
MQPLGVGWAKPSSQRSGRPADQAECFALIYNQQILRAVAALWVVIYHIDYRYVAGLQRAHRLSWRRHLPRYLRLHHVFYSPTDS